MKFPAAFAIATLLMLPAFSRADDKPTPSPTPSATPAASPAQSPAPEIAAEKRAEIEKMLKLTGTEKLMTQILGQTMETLKQRYPKLSQEYWQKLQPETDYHALLEQLIPVYDKYFTLDELKAANAFYESPAGQKVLSSRPALVQETMKIEQEFGRKLGQKIMDELKQDKPQDKKPEEDKGKTPAQ